MWKRKGADGNWLGPLQIKISNRVTVLFKGSSFPTWVIWRSE